MITTTIPAGNFRVLRTYWLLFIFISAMICLPIWITQRPPLADYPNHLARMYIYYHYDDVELFKARYDRIVEPIPNLAMDLIVPPLLRFFDVETAGKIFLMITVLLFGFGCHLLGSAVHGRPTWLALPCAFFSYNSLFLYGFVNYIFSLAMFFITLALWLRYRRAWNARTVITISLFIFTSYLAHLSAYLFLGAALVIITLFDVVDARRITRNIIVGLLPLFLPMAAFLTFMKGSGRTGQIMWNTAIAKLRVSVAWLFTYNYAVDFMLMSIILATMVVLAFYIKRLQIKWPVFTVGIVFGALFVACPLVLFTSWGADRRFLPPAAILAVMALQFEVPRRAGKYAFIIVLAVLTARLGVIRYEWNKQDKEIAEHVEMFNSFEEGTRIYPIVVQPSDPIQNRLQRPFYHTIQYSTIYHHTYTSTLFAIPGQQLLLLKDMPSHTDGYEEYLSPEMIDWRVSPDRIDWTLPGLTPDKVDWALIFNNHDYIWCYNMNASFLQYLKERCTLVASSHNSTIFRIDKRDATVTLR